MQTAVSWKTCTPPARNSVRSGKPEPTPSENSFLKLILSGNDAYGKCEAVGWQLHASPAHGLVSNLCIAAKQPNLVPLLQHHLSTMCAVKLCNQHEWRWRPGRVLACWWHCHTAFVNKQQTLHRVYRVRKWQAGSPAHKH